MVKRTNRIHNLNKMIQEYKREQEKFEVIQQDILNQQKQIEDLRLLILSTNFMNKNTSTSSSINTSTPKRSNSIKGKEMNLKESTQISKDHQIRSKSKISSKVKVFQDNEFDQSGLKRSNKQDQTINQLNKEANEKNQLNKDPNEKNQLNKDSNQLNRPKGLQTVNKNVLNQKDTKYFNDKLMAKFSSKSNESKKEHKKNDDLFEKADDLVKLISSKSTDDKSSELSLLNQLTSGKHMNMSNFENQENPIKDGLGINKISKSINKKIRPVKSSTLKPTKLTNSTNRLAFF